MPTNDFISKNKISFDIGYLDEPIRWYDFDLDDAQAAIKLDFKSTKHFELIKYLFLKICYILYLTFKF
jgi:hypothetical protein